MKKANKIFTIRQYFSGNNWQSQPKYMPRTIYIRPIIKDGGNANLVLGYNAKGKGPSNEKAQLMSVGLGV